MSDSMRESKIDEAITLALYFTVMRDVESMLMCLQTVSLQGYGPTGTVHETDYRHKTVCQSPKTFVCAQRTAVSSHQASLAVTLGHMTLALQVIEVCQEPPRGLLWLAGLLCSQLSQTNHTSSSRVHLSWRGRGGIYRSMQSNKRILITH